MFLRAVAALVNQPLRSSSFAPAFYTARSIHINFPENSEFHSAA
jgi:hypothetical protein